MLRFGLLPCGCLFRDRNGLWRCWTPLRVVYAGQGQTLAWYEKPARLGRIRVGAGAGASGGEDRADAE